MEKGTTDYHTRPSFNFTIYISIILLDFQSILLCIGGWKQKTDSHINKLSHMVVS